MRLPSRPTSRPFSRRRLRLALLSLALLAALILFLQVTLLPALLRAPLEAALGGSVRLTRVSFSLTPAIVAHNLRVIAPGVPGDASRILHAQSVRIELDRAHLLAGRITPTRVVLRKPVLRLSQHIDTAAINVASLSPSAPSSAATQRFPTIEIHDGAIELAEHSAASDYHPFFTLPIEGLATPQPDNPARCAFTLSSQPANSAAPPATVSGYFDASTRSGELALSSLSFADFADLWTPTRTSSLWTQLDIAGRIPAATLAYAPETGPVATFLLENVGINLPVPERSPSPTPHDLSSITADTANVPPARLLRMNDVSGRISIAGDSLSAELVGAIEDVRCRALLTTRALSLNAPFRLDLSTAEPFSLRQRAAILPFAPPIVHERLRTFSGPSAIVDAQVRISRDESSSPDTPAPLVYAGLLTFRDGRAAFEDFPYPFSKLSGVVRFTDTDIRIEKITGTHPSGAKLLAEGRIAPPTDDAEVDLRITAVDVPLDAEFASCLPPHAAPLLDAVFDTDAFDRLQALDLLPTEPAFNLAGRADLDIHVVRPLGHETEWTSDIRLTADRAGVLVRAFPLPADAENVTLTIRASVAEVSVPSMRPLSGGAASLSATIRLPDDPDADSAEPNITVAVRDLPVDALLLHAVDVAASRPDAPSSTVALLRRLNLSGLVEGDARIAPCPEHPDVLDYVIRVNLHDLASRPAPLPATPPCSLADLSGSLLISRAGFRIPALEGRILAADARDAGRFALTLDAPADPPSLTARVDATNFDLSASIENILNAVAPSETARALDLRAARDPRGRVDASISLRSDPDNGDTIASATLSAARDLSFLTPLGRLTASTSAGAAAIDNNALRFSALAGSLSLDAAPLGDVTLEGDLALADDQTTALALTFTSRDLDADTLHRLIESLAERPLDLAGLRLGAAFDLDAALTRAPFAPSLSTDVRIRPRSIDVHTPDALVRFPTVTGEIHASSDAVSFHALSASSPELTVTVDGAVTPEAGPDLRFTAEAPNLSPALRSLLPEDVRAAFDDISLDIQGPIALTRARLAPSLPSPGAPLAFNADASFAQASADFGISITDARGSLRLDAAPPHADIHLALDAMTVSGLSVENATANIYVDAVERTITLDRATASCHAGQIAADARIFPDSPGNPDSPSRFEADVALYGVAFGPVLAELRGQWSTPDDPDNNAAASDAATQPANAPPPDRGLLDAQLSLAGLLEDPATRTGRGSLRISQGRIVSLPFLNRLIELSNLSLPFNSPLDSAFSRFFIRADRVTFERLTLASDAVTLVGQGDLTWPDMNLDLRFTSRGNFRIPLISDLFEALRNEIITTTVTGPIASPEIAPSAFTGTRDLFDDLFSPPPPREVPTLRPDR